MRSCLRSVLVEPRPSDAGDPEAGWFLTDAGGCAVIDQSVECIRQGAVVEPGAGGSLQILERHTSLAVLGIKGGQDLQNGDTLQCVWSWFPSGTPRISSLCGALCVSAPAADVVLVFSDVGEVGEVTERT